jgi:hypothetical protein
MRLIPIVLRPGLRLFALNVMAALLLQAALPGTAFARPSLGTITVRPAPSLMRDAVFVVALEDAMGLLQQAFPFAAVKTGGTTADVQIKVQIVSGGTGRDARRREVAGSRALLASPDLSYQWTSRDSGEMIVLTLTSRSAHGARCGLYGLLQEKLGFRFLHPRQTVVPLHDQWPLPPVFAWRGEARFPKQGFHIHTLHPVELTEPLHDPDMPGAFEEVRSYIDWLARNQQNLFQFFLLRSVDRERWPSHAKRIVAYAHRRGIMAGVAISLSMLQQNAFQAAKLVSLSGYTRQVDAAMSWLMQVPWNIVSLDLSMGEYQPDLGRLMPGLRDHLIDELAGRYGRKVMLTTHVIRRQDVEGRRPPDGRSGVLVHTVMCYTIDEPAAPVYGNRNQRHMLTLAVEERGRREVWYWPESSYWVAFDSSVPLLLLPYLDARWRDMNTMSRLDVDGHLTFSSGWEWGYWLIDWSIARWAWNYRENGRTTKSVPLDRLRDLFPDVRFQRLWEEALGIQMEYLKERGLMPFFTALDPSAELFWPLDPPFAPRLPFTYKWLLDEATDDEVTRIESGFIEALEEYAGRMHGIVRQIRTLESGPLRIPDRESADAKLLIRGIASELTDALEVTALRAEHRAMTLRALIAARGEGGGVRNREKPYLDRAAAVRGRALELVQERERNYRYPVARIARKQKGSTSYGFGYLYPASDLHFWKREEEQVRHRRFDAFFMNPWDLRRISGVGSLLW